MNKPMIAGIPYHRLKVTMLLFFSCVTCFFIPAYSTDFDELDDFDDIPKLPDTFHITKMEYQHYDDISSFQKYISDSFGSSVYCERQNINNRGNDELIVYLSNSGGHTSGGGSHFWRFSQVIVYDIDSDNCLLDFEASSSSEGASEQTDSGDFINYISECYTYDVEFSEMQMTIQLIEQTSDDSLECIDVLGDKFIYKLTESGFVLDRKEKAELGNKENPLYGKMYERITDIPELKNWTKLGGGVIYPKNPENKDFKFGISNYKNENGDIIFIFNEFIENSKKGKYRKSKILDTLNIGKLNNNEHVWYQLCRKNKIVDSEIIAIVIDGECKNYEDNVVKAWRANTKTGKFQFIENRMDIDCAREHDCDD